MSIQTGIPFSSLADETWETLRTYEEVLAELDPNNKSSSNGANPLIAQAQKFGG